MVGDKQVNNSLLPVASSDRNRVAEGACLAGKTYFDVPFEQKETAKAAGLRWDSTIRKWYAASAEIAEAFSLSVRGSADPPGETERYYFKVPFLQKDRAKAMGMRFDGIRKLWFAPSSPLALDAARIFERIAD
jgi:Domain of unknown function (DUF5710)